MMAVRRAPKGGIRIAGQFFPGGQFIPDSAWAKASPQERAAFDNQVGQEVGELEVDELNVKVRKGDKEYRIVEKEEEPEPPVRTRTKAASDEAAESLTKALEAAEAGRKAAEETADAERRRAGEAARIANQRESENKTLREESEGKELTIITRDIECIVKITPPRGYHTKYIRLCGERSLHRQSAGAAGSSFHEL